MTVRTPDEILKDHIIQGVPSSGDHEVIKKDFRDTLNEWFSYLTGANSGALVFDSKALIDADLTAADKTMAWVVGDANSSLDGVYGKSGASGAGSWTKRAPLPYNIIHLDNQGAGTANAIQATSSYGIPSAAWQSLFFVNITADNTLAVTLAVNGETPKPMVLNTADPVDPGYLKSGMGVILVDDGTNYRLFSYGDATAVQAAAEAASLAAKGYRDQAAGYAAAALNNFTIDTFSGDGVDTTFVLTVDPGSANNCFVFVEAAPQDTSTYSLSGTTLTFTEAPPTGTNNIEVRYGNAVTVGTPADGTVTKIKLAAASVDGSKIDATDAAAIRTAIGVLGLGKVRQVKFLPGTGSPSNATTTKANLGSGFTVTRTSTTSKLLVFALAQMNSVATNNVNVGGQIYLEYYDGAAYQTGPNAATTINLVTFDAGKLNGAIYTSGMMFEKFEQAHLRSDSPADWTVIFTGNAYYSTGTLTLSSHMIVAVEFED